MKRLYLSAIAYSVVMLFTTCDGKSYKDHSLVHATPTDEAELEFFKNLDNFYNVTFWRRPSLVNKTVEFSIARYDLAELIRDTKDMNIDFFTVIRDLQSAFNNQTVKQYVRRRMDSFDWRNYYSVEDINNWLRDLYELHPRQVTLETIGQSVENRNILAVKVTLGEPGKRFKVIVEGGCHAREWISPAFVTFMINTILSAKNTSNAELREIAYAYDWVFIPLLNPDGYEFSQTSDRLWRKNLHSTYGVDLNRNFGISFGRYGSSKQKQSEEYCGPTAFSEPETSSLASFIRENCHNLLYYMAIHSYGQYIIIPYAFDKQHQDNFDEVKKMAEKAARRSKNNFGISYYTGTAFDTVGYFASGISTDWVKKSLNVSYVVAIELPDQGQTGFALPPDKILPTCQATMDMLLDFLAPKKGAIKQLDASRAEVGNRGIRTTFICSAILMCLNVRCLY